MQVRDENGGSGGGRCDLIGRQIAGLQMYVESRHLGAKEEGCRQGLVVMCMSVPAG